MAQYCKIRIVGSSGAGKTYLATKLSAVLGVPRTSLDELVYDFSNTNKFIHRRSVAQRDKIYRSVLRRKQWIMDGFWWSWTKDSYEQADIIIYLHKPLFLRTLNVFNRFFQRWRQGKCEGIPRFFELLKYNFVEGRKKAKRHRALFKELYGERLVEFTSADKALEWLLKN